MHGQNHIKFDVITVFDFVYYISCVESHKKVSLNLLLSIDILVLAESQHGLLPYSFNFLLDGYFNS